MRARHRPGDGPHEGGHFAGDGHHDLVGVLAPGHQPAVAFAEPHLRFPTDILDDFRELLQAQLQVTADLGRVAVRPGALDERPAGMRVAGLGDRPLTPPLPAAVFTGRKAQVAHELAGIVKAAEIAQFRDQGDGHGELHAAQGLDGFDHRQPPPGLDLGLEFRFQPLPALGVLGHRPHVLLEDNLLGGGRTDHLSQPAQMRRSPGGAPLIANVLAQQEGLEPHLGRLAIFEGIFPRPHHIPDRFVFHARARRRG